MSLDLEALLPDVARLLGVPPEEAATALHRESATELGLEDLSALVGDSLTKLIGMEVEVP